MKGRSWTESEDRLLAETVLQSVREGGNQLDAFEKVARRIGRTPGACGFRWNAVVRKREDEAFRQAKKQRVASQLKRKQEDSFSLKEVVRRLKEFESDYRDERRRLHHLEQRRKEKERLLREVSLENRRLKGDWEAFQRFQTDIRDRYANLLKLLETVRAAERGEAEPADPSADSGNADVGDDGASVDTERESHS